MREDRHLYDPSGLSQKFEIGLGGGLVDRRRAQLTRARRRAPIAGLRPAVGNQGRPGVEVEWLESQIVLHKRFCLGERRFRATRSTGTCVVEDAAAPWWPGRPDRRVPAELGLCPKPCRTRGPARWARPGGGPRRDLAHVLVLADADLGQVGGQHARQRVAELIDLVDRADEMVVHVAEVLLHLLVHELDAAVGQLVGRVSGDARRGPAGPRA